MRIICSVGTHIFAAIRDKVFGFNLSSTSSDATEYTLAEGSDSAINVITVSDDGNFLYASYTNKWICCWEISTSEIKGKFCYKKRPTSIVFGRFYIDPSRRTFANKEDTHNEFRDVLIIGDKSGEITAVDHFLTKEPVSCGAHTTSVITDAIMDNDRQLMVTCDRDGRY